LLNNCQEDRNPKEKIFERQTAQATEGQKLLMRNAWAVINMALCLGIFFTSGSMAMVR
jgi:hypothetical protein